MLARHWRFVALGFGIALGSSAGARAGVITVAEAAGVTTTTAIPVPNQIVETFEGFSPSNNVTNLSTNVGPLTSPRAAIVSSTDPTYGQYGGAIGSTRYYAIGDQSQGGPTATLTLPWSTTYFGMMWSAIDSTDLLQFYDGATLVGSFTGPGMAGTLSAAYFGNPSNPSLVTNEKFAFVNFYATGGDTFNRLVFTNSPSTGFEMDNFTLDRTKAVPEPSSLAMLATALVGGAGYLRRRLRAAC